MLSTVLYYELAMKVPNPVGITVYLLTWGLGHLRCLVVTVMSLAFQCIMFTDRLEPRLNVRSYKDPVEHYTRSLRPPLIHSLLLSEKET